MGRVSLGAPPTLLEGPIAPLREAQPTDVARPPLVDLRTWCPNLIAEAAQSIGTLDPVPKKRVVSLRPGCCSSPMSMESADHLRNSYASANHAEPFVCTAAHQ